MSSPLTGAPSAESIGDSFVWLRQETLTVLLLVAGAALWLSLWLSDIYAQLWPGWAFYSGLLALWAVCFYLRDGRYRLAAGLFVAGLFLAVLSLLLRTGEHLVTPFLFVAVVLVAGTLLGARASLLTAGAAIGATVAAPAVAGAIFRPLGAVSALLLIALAAFASWATTRNLYTTLRWMSDYSDQAARHLTDARAYQGQLAAALRQLELTNYRLERANHELAWARGEAEEARRMKAQFAANVSHELRTPINLVVGFADLMLGHPEAYGETPLPRAYLADLNVLHRSARHLQGLIDDILDISQIDAGEMPVVRDLTDVGAVVAEAVATARPLFERKGLSLDAEVAAGLPLVLMDRVRVRQILLNLLSNAARLTERGGAVVTVAADAREVTLCVADTGPGIRPTDLPHLFEAYWQAASRGRAGGTGLGLAIAKRFVDLHGGRIWADSAGPGHGSRFGFTLPRQADVAIAAGDDTRSAWLPRLAAEPPAATLVVADGDPAVVGLFQRRLSGYRVVGAASIAEALGAATAARAHAILADLPEDADLAAWCRTWAAAAAQSGARVLGCPMPSGRRSGHALGLADYLVKPVTRETLLAAIEALAAPIRTILIIDDEPRMVRLIVRMLRSAPRRYRILRAHDGREGLAAARRERPDLVLLDMLMPEMDGFGVLRSMRSDPDLRDTPVIAVTAHGAMEPIEPSTGRMVALVAPQPYAVTGLLRSVQLVLDRLPPPDGWSAVLTRPAAPAG